MCIVNDQNYVSDEKLRSKLVLGTLQQAIRISGYQKVTKLRNQLGHLAWYQPHPGVRCISIVTDDLLIVKSQP